jgi:hypothetical protein
MGNYTTPPREATWRRDLAEIAANIWTGIKRLPATVAALTCTGVGISYNAQFAQQFGDTAIALAVASDVLKALAGPAFMAAVRSREWGRAGAAFVVGLVTLAVSLVAAFGSAQHVREANTDERRNAIRAYDDAEKLKRSIEDELAALGTPRPVAMIQADIKNFKIDAGLWQRSKECEEATKPDTQSYCQPILDLYKERGAAARKTELEAQGKNGMTLAALNAIIAKGKPAHADPQAAAIAALTGLEEDHIRIGISILIVALIETGSIGGSIMATKPVPRRRRAMTAAIDKPAEEMSLAELRALQPLLRDDATTPPEWDPPKPRNRRKPRRLREKTRPRAGAGRHSRRPRFPAPRLA